MSHYLASRNALRCTANKARTIRSLKKPQVKVGRDHTAPTVNFLSQTKPEEIRDAGWIQRELYPSTHSELVASSEEVGYLDGHTRRY